jgi:hypothetical protein
METSKSATPDAVDEKVVRDAIREVVRSFAGDPERLEDAIVRVLEGLGTVPARDERSLLNAHGAMLCEIAATPSATLRSLGNRLGWSESRAQKVVSDLVRAGLVSRTRSGKGVRYKFARNRVLAHGDTIRFAGLLLAVAPEEAPKD